MGAALALRLRLEPGNINWGCEAQQAITWDWATAFLDKIVLITTSKAVHNLAASVLAGASI